jgi:replicative DNA helicase
METPERKLFSEEAEIAVLGGLMLAPDKIPAVRERLHSGDFVDFRHKLVWKAIMTVHDSGLAVDLVTVMEQMERDGTLPHPVEMAYIMVLAKETPSAANVESYAKLVHSYALRRGLTALSETMTQWAHDDKDALGIIGKVREHLDRLDNVDPQQGPRAVGEVMIEALQELDLRAQRPPGLTGLSTGLLDLDNLLDGLQAGRLYIVAARPAMGKSVLVMQLAREAVRNDRAVAFFSLEMPGDELCKRMWAMETQIDYGRIQNAQLQPAEWTSLCDVTTAMRNTKLWIDETSGLALADVLNRVRRLHRIQPLSLVIVDYIGLLKGPSAGNREQEVAAMSRAFKLLAKELKIPVIVVAQLNRGVEGRVDKRPNLSDLRESGALEQDADCVLMLYRDEVYDPASPDKGCAEILIRKQRAGKIGTVAAQFQGEFCRFNNLAGGLPSAQSSQSGGITWP